MSTIPVPPLYVRLIRPAKASLMHRAIALGVAVLALGVLVVAAELTASPTGMGTHEALGLRACAFVDRAGLPCPSCGMTTSFAHFADGNWPVSVYTQPMGFALAVLAGIAVWAGGYAAISGRPVWRVMRAVSGMVVVISLLTLAVAGWAWKIWLVVREG